MRDIRWPEEMKIPHEKCSCTACWYACGINRGIMESKRAWQEAQAGEYIKQAVDNGYSLKSDKPPLSALDEDEIAKIIREIDPHGAPRKIAKAICSKFGTPPSGKRVSVERLIKIMNENISFVYSDGIEDAAKAIHAEVYGGGRSEV